MNQLKISTRLSVLLGVMSALLVIIGGIGLYGIGKGDESLHSVYADHTIPITQISEIQYLQLRSLLSVVTAQRIATNDRVAQSVAEVKANTEKAQQLWVAYQSASLSAEESSQASEYAALQQKYLSEGLQPALQALQDNDLHSAGLLMDDKVGPSFEAMREQSGKLMATLVEGTKAAYESSVARVTVIRTVSIASILVGLAFASVFGLSLVRGITKPLNQAVRISNAVAAGSLNEDIPVDGGKDEISELLRALAAMQASLVQVVSTVRGNAEGVANACNEIAHGNHDLSARTERQASTLEETAASMEELSDAVHHNSEAARQANQLAQNASSVALRGGEVVSQVVDTMHAINSASNRIADIIGVIDGIAFQTNILALNAAVEAARAGEQGRGFAVVASEVRSLAGRSAEAAKEIKGLIQASVDTVERGSHLVDQAGTTMAEVVDSIRKVTDIMGNISAASAEQSQGVSQVGQAVGQMDQVTQQNAALVEQMAAAASSLNDQARDLVGAVAVFQLGNGHEVTASINSVQTPTAGVSTQRKMLR
ncbi:MAG: HAMP domain-containing protein [Rhodoferax sp.]|nr:MAG: HAMP domain-containing protein [Rhodoferax sp.]